MKNCPGAQGLKGTPTLTEKICPECGKCVEIFSVDMIERCQCGFTIYNDTISCVKWCAYAKECVGHELYQKLTAHKQSSMSEI